MKNDSLLQLILEQSQIGLWDLNIQTLKFKVSKSAKDLFGFNVDEIPDEIDFNFLQKVILPEDFTQAKNNLKQHINSNGATPYEVVVRYRHHNGSILYLLSRGKIVEWDELGKPKRMVGCHVDISNQKQLEEALRNNKEILRNIINNIPYAVFWKDGNSVFQGSNKPFADFYGYNSVDEIKGVPTSELINHPKELLLKYIEDDKEVMLNDKVKLGIVENAINLKGEKIIIETSKVPLKDKDVISIGLLGIFNDITENENLKKELSYVSKLYHILNQINKLLANIGTRDKFLHDVCNITTAIGGFKLAWVGMVEGAEVKVIAYSGNSSDYLKKLKITIDDTPLGNGPFGICIKTGNKYIFNDFQNDTATFPWKDKAIKSGLFSGIALPIKLNSKVIGAMLIYEGVKDFFKAKEIALLAEIVVAIELGIGIIEQQLVYNIANNKVNQLASIIQQSKSYIAIVNAENFSFVYMNDSMKKAFELNEDEEVSKYSVFNFRDANGIDLIKNVIMPAIDSKGLWSGEGEFISKSGKIIPVIQNVIPLKNEFGYPEFYSTTSLDISEIKEKEKELKKLSQELRSLSHHLVSVKEKERKIIAKEIHDELGQDLTGLKMGISWLIKHIDDDKEKIINKLNEVNEIAVSTVQTSRRLYNSIYPQMLEEVGLIDTIRWHFKNYISDDKLTVKILCNINEDSLFAGNHDLCLTLFRIYQESFTNILRYAKATEVIIKISMEGNFVTMVIQDNGIGFDPLKVDKKLHHGLLGMRERVNALEGNLDISSQIGHGTAVSVSIGINEDIENPVSW